MDHPNLQKESKISGVGYVAGYIAAVLDIIFASQELEPKLKDKANIKALRLTCKALRNIVDDHVTKFSNLSICRGTCQFVRSDWPLD
jgi:hypothetical protein